jgi:hypothetical protein
MTTTAPRSTAQRLADVRALLAGPMLHGWVATAAPDGTGNPLPHLVPLSVVWLGERLVIALELTSRTARGLQASGVVRVGLGTTTDVVLVDAVLERSVPVAEAPTELADGYAAGTDWEPRSSGGSYGYVVLRPERIQAWRDEPEIAGRTVMRWGRWLES